MLNPRSIVDLLPPHLAQRGVSSPEPTPLEHLLGLQVAVLMFMIAMVNMVIMLYAVNPKVVRGYVLASTITDIPHWSALLYVLGWDGISQWRTWNLPLYMQMIVPSITIIFKLGYLTGAFGEDRLPRPLTAGYAVSPKNSKKED